MEARRKSVLAFTLAGLAVAASLALFLAPWASSSPDGLEKVAEDKGFNGEAAPGWEVSPAPDYAVPGLEESHPALATGLAGLAGTIAIFFAAWGLALLLKKRGDKTRAESPAEGGGER